MIWVSTTEWSREALEAGLQVAKGVDFYIQFGSQEVEEFCRKAGFLETFQSAGVHLIKPGCGACIGCGPGVSETEDQVTVSAINRNYKGRSGPGRLYLASPLTVAASAFTRPHFSIQARYVQQRGRIVDPDACL